MTVHSVLTFKKTRHIFAATALAAILGASVSVAGTLAPILADGNDQTAYGDGTGKWVGQSVNRIGRESETRDNAFIIPFALPTLAAGENIASASISLNVKTQNGPFGGDTAWNIDVYGVRANNSSVVDLVNDAYIGANDGGATKVEDNFFVGLDTSVTLGVHSSSAAGETALGAWLQTFYTGSVPNQTYAFIRFNSDDAAMVAGRYLTVDSGNAGSDQPSLTITTEVFVPGPPSASFTASPQSGNAPLVVGFSDTSSGSISNRLWNFGDGSTFSTTNKNTSHTYTTEGLRTVQLIVSGEFGSSTNTMTDLIDVAPPITGFTIPADVADASIGVNEVDAPTIKWPGQSTLAVADNNYVSDQGDNCSVIMFALPDLGGSAISSANLDIDLHISSPGATNYPAELDLYGVRYAASPTVLLSDYAPVGSNVGNGDVIQTNVASVSNNNDPTYTNSIVVGTSVDGDAALATWIAAQYDAGAVAGDYVFLRFNATEFSTNPWNIASADTATLTVPTLTIELDTTVPAGEADFVSAEAAGAGLVKLVFTASGPREGFKLVGRDDLVFGSWDYTPHSDDGVNAFVTTNLLYSSNEGTNYAIYVEATNAAAFFGIE